MGSSSDGSSSASYESFPDGMTEEESLQIWLRRNDEMGEQVLRERQQQEQQQQTLGSGEAVADHDRGSAPGSQGVVRSRSISGSEGSAGSRSGGDRGGSPVPPAERPDLHEDPGANPLPFDEQALRDAQRYYQHLLDLSQVRLRRHQELELEARRREREAAQREREATQRLEEAIQRREALERQVYAEVPAVPLYAAPLADQGLEYERLLMAQYAMAVAAQENDAMRREEEAHQRRMRAANDAMRREEEAHQRWMRAVAQRQEARPGATSNDFAIGGPGAPRDGPPNAAPLASQAGEYEGLSQAHYATAAQANDAGQREEEAQQRRMRSTAPHHPPSVITTANNNNNSSNNSMNDSSSSTADYSSGSDKAMKGDGSLKTNTIATTKNIDKSSSSSANDSASSTTARSGDTDKKPEYILFYPATPSPTQYNTQPVTCMNCNASLYTQPLARGYICQGCGYSTTLTAEGGEMGNRDANHNTDASVDALEEKMMDLWCGEFDNEGMDRA